MATGHVKLGAKGSGPVQRFGAFELNLETGELRKGGIRVRLQPKSFQVLKALLEQPGRLVTRDELRRRLWEDETFVDFESGLNTAINRLRTALGDSADTPLYIETTARSGYRFIAPLHDDLTQASAALGGVPENGSRTYPKLALYIGVSLAAAAVAAAVIWIRQPPLSEPQFHQLTFQRGNIYGARFSPSGHDVLYAAEWEGGPRMLYLTDPVSPESRTLGFSGASLAAVSRLGEVALIRSGGTNNISGGTLFRVPLNGGAPLEVDRNIMSAEWSPDGAKLALVRAINGRNQLEFPSGTVLYRTAGWISSPRFSPDGKSIAFLDHPVRHDDAGDVKLIDTAGKLVAKSDEWLSVSGLAWHPLRNEIWFTAARKGSLRSLWAWRPLTQSWTGVRPVTQSAGILTLRDIGSDGRVLVSRDTRRLEMAGRMGPGGVDGEERNLSWLDWSRVQEISSDGGLILFDEGGEGAGPQNIAYVRSKDGTTVRVGEGRAMGFSPDLKTVLALGSHERTHFRILSLSGGPPRDLPAQGLEYQWGRFLPDGKRVLALASEPGKGLRLYVHSLDPGSGQPTPITPEMVVRNIAVSPEGDRVAVLEAGGKLALYPTTPGPSVVIPVVITTTEPLAPVHWSRDGRYLFVQHMRGNELPAKVSKLDLATGDLREWREFAPTDRMGATAVTGIVVSADERSYAYSYRRLLAELFVVDGLK